MQERNVDFGQRGELSVLLLPRVGGGPETGERKRDTERVRELNCMYSAHFAKKSRVTKSENQKRGEEMRGEGRCVLCCRREKKRKDQGRRGEAEGKKETVRGEVRPGGYEDGKRKDKSRTGEQVRTNKRR